MNKKGNNKIISRHEIFVFRLVIKSIFWDDPAVWWVRSAGSVETPHSTPARPLACCGPLRGNYSELPQN